MCRMDKWVVHKFGGSSVADAACFRRVAEIIEASSNPREAIVLSACRGVTDSLLELVALAEQPNKAQPSKIRNIKFALFTCDAPYEVGMQKVYTATPRRLNS